MMISVNLKNILSHLPTFYSIPNPFIFLGDFKIHKPTCRPLTLQTFTCTGFHSHGYIKASDPTNWPKLFIFPAHSLPLHLLFEAIVIFCQMILQLSLSSSALNSVYILSPSLDPMVNHWSIFRLAPLVPSHLFLFIVPTLPITKFGIWNNLKSSPLCSYIEAYLLIDVWMSRLVLLQNIIGNNSWDIRAAYQSPYVSLIISSFS